MDDFTPPASGYREVADALRQAIEEGKYQPGQKLPSQNQLAEQHQLDAATINRALRQLVNEGLIEIRRGRGTFVRNSRRIVTLSTDYVTKKPEGWGTWSSVLSQQGMTGTQKILQVATVDPPSEVARCLKLADGEQVVVRRRLLYADDEPVQLADSYYPASLAAGTELAERKRMPGGTMAALERLGVRFGPHVDETFLARMPTWDEARMLNLTNIGGVPVLRHTRVTYDRDGRPVEYSIAILRGDRHVLNQRVPTGYEQEEDQE